MLKVEVCRHAECCKWTGEQKHAKNANKSVVDLNTSRKMELKKF